MTEAKIVTSDPPTFLDMSQASSFASEMFALIPENLLSTAYITLAKELDYFEVQFTDNRFYNLLNDLLASYN